MLNDKDRIFKNLYNDLGADFVSAKKKGETGLTLKSFVLKEKSG
jgi:hypothetical protein